MSTLFDMVQQVFADTDAKLKMAEAQNTEAVENREPEPEKVASVTDHDQILKLASACEELADSLPSIVDDRAPAEKLAELMAVNEKLAAKLAGEMMAPAVPVEGVESALRREAADAPGESLDTPQTGEATPAHISPKTVQPGEKAFPTDAPTALDTNKEMMMPDQPEDVLKQAEAAGLIPASFARAFEKMGSDVDNPASVSNKSSTPDLQSAPGVPDVQSQGSEAGENTPRETAPTSGEGGGRQLLSSNESAINATKREAKSSTIDAISEVLTEPAMSKAHDKTLDESLENASSAGVKIAAARELLRKYAETSPEAAKQVEQLLKAAQGLPPAPAAPAAAPAAQPAPAAAVPPEMAQGAGVTPEEVAEAQMLLEQIAAQQAAAQQQQMAAPAPVPAQQPPAGIPAPGQAPVA